MRVRHLETRGGYARELAAGQHWLSALNASWMGSGETREGAEEEHLPHHAR